MRSAKMRRLIVVMCCLLPLTARAESIPFEAYPEGMAKRYSVLWNGIQIADFVAGFEKNTMQTRIETFGLVKDVSKYANHCTTTFTHDETYIPQQFSLKMRQRKPKFRSIDIQYDQAGKIISDVVNPPDNRAKRPAVPDELKQNEVDPLTLSLRVRDRIQAWREGKGEANFTMRYYDGRRLVEVPFAIKGKQTFTYKKQDMAGILLEFRRNPVSGFTNKELDRYKSEEPDFKVYVMDDRWLLPIYAEAKAPLGFAIISLEKDCGSMDQCMDKDFTRF